MTIRNHKFMIYPSILERKYDEYRPFVEEAAKKVKETLLNFSDRQGYAFISRIKSIESIAEKIETGRFKKWSEIDDLFACTIIIPTLSHEEEVISFCKNTFEIIRITKRGQNKKSPDTFRFDSTRIYTRLKQNKDIAKNTLSIYQITFEIQNFIAILVSDGIIKDFPENYYCHITTEVISLFPVFANITSSFEYD